MAATSARSGFGSLLKRGDGGGPEVFTTVAEVVNIGGISTRLNTADATHMESPDGWMEKIATLLEAAEVQLDMNFLPGDTTQSLLRSDQTNRTLRNFQVTVPGSSKVFAFAAFVGEISPAFPPDNKMAQSLTLTPSGPITFS